VIYVRLNMKSPASTKRRDWLKAAFAVGLSMATPWSWATSTTNAKKPPAEVLAAFPDAHYRGSGKLTFLGLHVYDARLWVQNSFNPESYEQQALALELEYARKLKGELIAERSLVEMRKHSDVSPQQAEWWMAEMKKIFPDVAAGDRITGLQFPGESTHLYLNGKLRGEVRDAEFTRAFFSIWLSPRTSEPKLRLALLKPQLGRP
jgi:Chalcone isomerase-like